MELGLILVGMVLGILAERAFNRLSKKREPKLDIMLQGDIGPGGRKPVSLSAKPPTLHDAWMRGIAWCSDQYGHPWHLDEGEDGFQRWMDGGAPRW